MDTSSFTPLHSLALIQSSSTFTLLGQEWSHFDEWHVRLTAQQPNTNYFVFGFRSCSVLFRTIIELLCLHVNCIEKFLYSLIKKTSHLQEVAPPWRRFRGIVKRHVDALYAAAHYSFISTEVEVWIVTIRHTHVCECVCAAWVCVYSCTTLQKVAMISLLPGSNMERWGVLKQDALTSPSLGMMASLISCHLRRWMMAE